MSEMKEMIEESVIKIMQKYSSKDVINSAEQGDWAGELWESLSTYGMLWVAIPEESGGSGGDYVDALSILRLAGKYSAPIPLAETYIANWILNSLGESITGEILTIANETATQPLQIQKSGKGMIVTGKAINAPYARYAEKLVAFGETGEGPILAILKLENAKIEHGENLAGEARDTVLFENVYVNDCKTILIDLQEMSKKVFYAGALTRCAMMAGALENILELSITHTTERSQFGRPLHRLQAIQHHLAQLAGETSAAAISAKYAAEAFGENSFPKEIAFAKIRVNEAAGKAAPIAHQVLAAIGFTYEHTLHHSTRRLWSWRDEFGTETSWGRIVADELLKLENNNLWSLITGVEENIKVGDIK